MADYKLVKPPSLITAGRYKGKYEIHVGPAVGETQERSRVYPGGGKGFRTSAGPWISNWSRCAGEIGIVANRFYKIVGAYDGNETFVVLLDLLRGSVDARKILTLRLCAAAERLERKAGASRSKAGVKRFALQAASLRRKIKAIQV